MAPTLVSSNPFPTTITRSTSAIVSASIAVQAGDILVCKVCTEDSSIVPTAPTNSGTALTWMLRATTGAVSSREYAVIYTAPVGASTSLTVSCGVTGGSAAKAAVVNVWRGAQLATTPATNTTKTGSGTPSATLTTTGADSVVDWVKGDWNTTSGTNSYLSSATQESKALAGGVMEATFAHQAAPSAGSQTFGLSSPGSQLWAMLGIEVQNGFITKSGTATATARLVAARDGAKHATGPGTGTAKLGASSSGSKRAAAARTATARLAAASTGAKHVTGAATAVIRLSAASTGLKINLGLATIRLSAAILSASRPGSGQATARLRLSASATAAPRTASGAATAIIRLAASGPGAKHRTTTRTATIRVSAAGTGIKRVPTTRTAVLRLASSVSGTKSVPTTRTATLRVTTSLSGRFHVSGSAHTAVLRLVAVPAGVHATTPAVAQDAAVITIRAAASGTRIVAEVVTPLRPTASLAIAYELVCIGRIPQTSGPPTYLQIDPIDWTGLSYVDELSKPQQLNAGVAISSITEAVLQRLRDLSDLATELWLYRQGRLVFAGPLLGWQVQGETLTLNASGLLTYLKMMIVDSDQVFSQQDQTVIATKLIDQWQNLDYGNFGIDTTGIPPSGVLRDGTYLQKELHNVYQRVTEMGARENGFDVSVDPQSRKLRLAYPLQGVDRSSGEDAIVFDARNVTSPNIICSSAPGDVASESYGTGTSSGSDTVYTVQSNLELRARYGRSAYAANYDGVSEQATLDDHAEAALETRSDALLVPGPDTRVTPDADLSQYDVGDTINYQLHEQLSISGAFRMRKRQVTVSKTGQETVSLSFA